MFNALKEAGTLDPVDDRIGSMIRRPSDQAFPRKSSESDFCIGSGVRIVHPLPVLLDRDTTAVIRFADLIAGSRWIVTYEIRRDGFRAITLSEEEVNALIHEIIPAAAVELAFAAPDDDWYEPARAERMVADGPLLVNVRLGLTAYLNPKDSPPSIRLHCASDDLTVKVPYLFVSIHVANFLSDNSVQS